MFTINVFKVESVKLEPSKSHEAKHKPFKPCLKVCNCHASKTLFTTLIIRYWMSVVDTMSYIMTTQYIVTNLMKLVYHSSK